MRANEFTPGNQDLIIFDIDDTLLHTTAKIKVVDAASRVIRTLTNQEFNNYQLQPGEEFDFGEFRSAEKFRQESKPILPMIRKLKTILSHAGNSKVIMLTARADFDDKETFLQTFKDLGIDMSRVHVHRAGNIPGNEPPAYKKAIWVRKYLNTRQYGHVRLYDDSMSNLRVFKELKKEYPRVDFRAIYVGPTGSTQVIENQDEYEIRNYEKLDNILYELCNLVIRGQRKDPNKYGMVAAAVLDTDNNLVKGINLPGPNGKRRHAERVAIENYTKKFGKIPAGSIILTTCSPCSEEMAERYGDSCTELINQHGVKKVYAGYMDPTQEEEHRDYNIMETENSSIRDMCKEFADTFLHLREGKGKWHISPSGVKTNMPPADDDYEINYGKNGLVAKFRKEQGLDVKTGSKKVKETLDKPTPTLVTIARKFNVTVDYVTQQLQRGVEVESEHTSNLEQAKEIALDHLAERPDYYQKLDQVGLEENFADGKNPGRKGLAKRSGVNCKASVTQLRKVAKNSSGEKQRMAHWCANMKSGRNK